MVYHSATPNINGTSIVAFLSLMASYFPSQPFMGIGRINFNLPSESTSSMTARMVA